MKVAYIINSISTTSIPLEMGNQLKNKKGLSFKVFCFYKEKKNSKELLRKFGYDPNKEVVFVNFNKRRPLKSLKSFIDAINKFDPDLIHTHHTFSAFMGRLIGRFKSIKVLSTIHGEYFRYTSYQKLLHLVSINLADSIICNSNSTRMNLKWVRNKKKVEVIYNGIPVGKLSDVNKKNKILNNIITDSESDFIIGTVGRIVELKRHKDIIDGLSKILKAEIPNKKIKLFIIGEGPLRKELEQYTKEIGLDQNVVFLGELPREQVHSFLNEIDLFIMASRSEGFCNALVEAMAAKRPILLSNIDTFHEVTKDNNKSNFFKLGDIDDLAGKLWSAINNPESEEAINRRFKLVMNQYSLEKCTDLYFNEYEKLIVTKEWGLNE